MNRYRDKIKVMHDLKAFLEENHFTEVITPVLRRDLGELIKRVQVENIGALRDSHELQLRYLLSIYDSIYEIGPCFRRETPSKEMTNETEFCLMELFTQSLDLEQLKTMLQKFVLKYKPKTEFVEISVADYICANLGIDLYVESQSRLIQKLSRIYKEEMKPFEYVIKYIEEEIEPLSKDKVVFFTDYPECTCSYANIKGGVESNVVSRFELFANGVEIANGFDDECDAQRFVDRNAEYPIFAKEEECIAQLLALGRIPSKSAGLGIGIERLCMFLLNEKDIKAFRFPSDIF